MRRRNWLFLLAAGFTVIGLIYAQKPFRQYPAFEYYNFPLPPDYQEKTEWAFGRLIYPADRELCALDHGLSALGPASFRRRCAA